MTIEVTTNADKVSQFFHDIAQSRIKAAQTGMVNDLAFRARQAVYDEMDMVLNPPLKRYTLTSMRVDKAKYSGEPVSHLYLNDARGEDKAIGHLFKGGNRKWKNMEGALLRKGLMLPGMYAVPGQAAPLDQYGNIPASFIRSILAYFQALNEGNMKQRTKKLKSKTGIDKETGYKTIFGTEYFISFGPGRMSARTGAKSGVSYQQNQHLKPGIYSRTGTHGAVTKPIIMFVPRRKMYRRYINLPALGQRTVDNFASQYFAKRLAAEIAKSKQVALALGWK